jgi:hypothetical protein
MSAYVFNPFTGTFDLSGFDPSANYTLTGVWVWQQNSDIVPVRIETHSSSYGSNALEIYDVDASALGAWITADGSLVAQSVSASYLGLTFGVYNMVLTSALTGNRTITFPNATGTVCLLTGAQGLATKTLASSCVFDCDAVVGPYFRDVSATTQRVIFDLREISGGTNRVPIWPDASGHVLLDGGVLTHDDEILTYDGDVLTY